MKSREKTYDIRLFFAYVDIEVRNTQRQWPGKKE
jgi:hypothetical protein